MTAKKNSWLTIYALNWLVIVYFWLQGSGGLLNDGTSGILIAAGRLLGLVAAYCILLQFFLMGRLPFLERVFGLDHLSILHQKNGKYGLVFILVHPVLITLGYSLSKGTGFFPQFFDIILNYKHALLAAVGLVLFLVVVGTSLYIIRSKLRYESWYFVHLLAYFAVFFSFFHQINLGGDLLQSKIFYSYWIALYIIVFGNHLVFRFGRPLYLIYLHRFRVSDIKKESPTSVSVYISGLRLNKFKIEPGQFMIIRFLDKANWWQAHPFSLSKIPDNKNIRVTVKELGDFTKSIHAIKPGTPVIIDGPYGVFTDLFSISDKILFVAGGIGITPVRSLMENMLKKSKNVILLYSNKYSNDIVFKSELDALQKTYNTKIIHIISNEPGYIGESGRIDEKKLQRLVPDLREREVYLCGPVPMMNALIPLLRKYITNKNRLHFEKFSF